MLTETLFRIAKTQTQAKGLSADEWIKKVHISWFPWWFSDKDSACSLGEAGDVGSIPESGRSPGGGHENPL